jgi:tryptophan-rich sensory protein
MRKKVNLWMLLLFIVASEAIGSIGSLTTIPAISAWYQFLKKPPLNPPNWIFGPVWTLLFACMGVSAYLVWQEGLIKKPVKNALTWFGIQFLFNVLWSFLFFGARSPVAGFVCIGILWIAIVGTILSFLKVNKTAGFLLVPYFLWVSFATYLNAGIVILN